VAQSLKKPLRASEYNWRLPKKVGMEHLLPRDKHGSGIDSADTKTMECSESGLEVVDRTFRGGW
jgi:hypothetical protein